MNEDNQSNIGRTNCNKNIEQVTTSSSFLPVEGDAPSSVVSTSDPCAVIGGNTIRLTEPDLWMHFEQNGRLYAFPAYLIE